MTVPPAARNEAAATEPAAAAEARSTAPRPRLPGLVGVGASAGGLDPLIGLLSGLPPGAGLAVMVVQHMAADHSSALPALLQPHTRMRVHEAIDGEAIAPDHVYVITPGRRLTIEDGRMRVTAPTLPGVPARQVDALFMSMASQAPTRAVGIVLSGMGADGSDGLRALLAAGGAALAQAPETAQFDAMPLAAAAVSPRVRVMAVGQMPAAIRAALPTVASEGPRDVGLAAANFADAQADDASHDAWLAGAIRAVAGVTGHDFSHYKSSTLRRRIERRMAVHGISRAGEYLRLLQASSQEAELLFKEMLIGVTALFRDPAVWEALARDVLPGLLATAAARPQPQFRAWIAGCSTGEEAYTLAMLLQEAVDANPAWAALAVQIFATDLSPDAIQFARRGVYPPSAVQPLTPQRLARHFVRDGGDWRVTKALRERVLFAQHDLIVDPPFTRLDLVSCRNLLIYFKSALQQRILPLFHYALRKDGILVLGTAETTGRFDANFPAVDAKLRIHRRAEAAVSHSATLFPVRILPMNTPMPAPSSADAAPAPAPDTLQTQADRLMLEQFAPPAVLVSALGDILYVSGRTGRFLEPAAGKANWNLHAMLREGLRPALMQALTQAQAEARAVSIGELVVDSSAGDLRARLTVSPVNLPGQAGLMMVLFEESRPGIAPAPTPPAPRTRGRARGSRDGTALQQALEELQALREETQSSQEELQSANEELQSTNEELQSANEELTTSKEEMQAMNEELQTVNAELLSKLDDLALAQSDLKNLLNSTEIATLFLDGALNVRRFTEQAKRVINLRDSDVGRPLSDLTSMLEYPSLREDIVEVLRSLAACASERRTADGRWYSVRIMPYRTQDNVIDGAVITFADISAAKALEARLRLLTPAVPAAGSAEGAA